MIYLSKKVGDRKETEKKLIHPFLKQNIILSLRLIFQI